MCVRRGCIALCAWVVAWNAVLRVVRSGSAPCAGLDIIFDTVLVLGDTMMISYQMFGNDVGDRYLLSLDLVTNEVQGGGLPALVREG